MIIINNPTFQQKHFYRFVVMIVIFLNCFSFLGQTTTTLYPDKDAMVYDKIPTNNYSTYTTFRSVAWTNGGPFLMRSLIEFDLSTIPSNAIITDATLTLFGMGHNPLTKSNASYLQRIDAAWSETTVTWNNQPTSNTTNQITLDSSTSTNQNYALDVADHVQDMIDFPANDHGFLLRLQSEIYYTDLIFGSSDYSDTTKHPKLEITYVIETDIAVDSIIHRKVLCDSDSDSTTSGAIYITPSGGASGYTYSWSGPNSFTSSSQDITGLSDEGLYTVIVTPGIGNKDTLTIGLGYSTDYGFYYGTQEVINGTEVNIKNVSGSNNWCMGAGSNNILADSTDGWIEYMVTSTNKHRLMGFSSYSKTSSCWGYLDYGMYLKNNGYLHKVVNGTQTSLGSAYAIGDLLRVSREGDTIKFYKNNVDLGSSVAGVSLAEMHADISIYDNGSSIENMACSFRPPMEITATITNISCGDTIGGIIELDPCGSGYTYSWSPGNQTTSTITGLTAGTNTVTITGSNNWIVKKSFSVGYDVYWGNFNNATYTYFGKELEKTSGSSSAWDAGGNSLTTLAASTDGWIEYTVTATNKNRILGFTENPVSTHPNTSVDYGVRLDSDSTCLRTISGTEVADKGGTIKNGDIIKLDRIGTGFGYYLNGFKYGPATVSATEVLYVESSFYSSNGKLENVRTSINCPAYMTNVKGVLMEKVEAASSYQLAELNVKFNYYEKYHVGVNKKLIYNIYDESRSLVAGVDENGTLLETGSPTQAIAYGHNACLLDLSSLTSLTSGEYILEVISPKNDKTYLRFKL